MSEELKKLGEEGLNTTITNPFLRDCITSVYVSMTQINRRGAPHWIHWGEVEFKKGNTTGKQRFDGDSFDSIVLQIKNFINNEL